MREIRQQSFFLNNVLALFSKEAAAPTKPKLVAVDTKANSLASFDKYPSLKRIASERLQKNQSGDCQVMIHGLSNRVVASHDTHLDACGAQHPTTSAEYVTIQGEGSVAEKKKDRCSAKERADFFKLEDYRQAQSERRRRLSNTYKRMAELEKKRNCAA